ncbi:hypothetical protein ANN_17540 [Periplaneta americana]|uniref:DNA-directed DNA polymerase n=1 Tax=Periplaneta americana TaxID=6978 RepID=A0ABQ8ST78_PERAM|nr:hypothetical protein ANN_17540 [Periplaneta americana]
MVTDVKATYEKLYEDENSTPVMSTALVQTSEMVTPSTSGVDVEMTTPSTSGADAGMGASSTPIAALVSGSSQVCSESVFTLSDRAFKNRLKTYIARNLKNHDRELKDILDCIADEMEDILKGNLKEQLALKFNIFVECVFANVHNETIFHNFKSKNDVLYQYSDISEFVNKQKEKILKEFEECSMKGSGLFYVKLHKLELRVNKYTPLMGGSAYIELPHRYKNSKSLVNIANSDIYCFKYCILSKFLDKEKNFMSSYVNRPDLECKYDWCIDFPVGIKDIAKFEKRNDISINVFALDENDDVFPLRICEKELPDHRDLLYISNENTSHYCCITNFSALVKPQLTAAAKSQIAVCKRCFAYFRHNAFRSCAERLKDHESVCSQFSAVRSVFPNKEYLSFDHPEFSQQVRFVIYADFECLLEPIENCHGNPDSSYTVQYQKHTPFSYCYVLKDSQDTYTDMKLYRGCDAAKHFVQDMVMETKKIEQILFDDIKEMIPLTSEENVAYSNANICHICKKGNFTVDNYKVRDHDHLTGKFRGAAHNECNLRYQHQHFIPIVLHNLSSYDGHFIVRELGYDDNPIQVLPNTQEKYISFVKNVPSTCRKKSYMQMRFLDSFRFMPSSLAQLADNLPKDKFSETKKMFKDKFDLVSRKGVFPYDYLTTSHRLEDNCLPPKEKFFSKLNNEHITEKDYNHAKCVWEAFNIQTLGEYSDLYLKSDILILTDVFENFREMCMTTYDLDCMYYYTVPGLAYSAMLKLTGVELQLITDMTMLLLFEQGIRGGICQCVTRHAVANDPKSETFDNSKSPSSIYYVDANNLYGFAMSQKLPYGGFEWLSDEEINNFDLQAINDDSEIGYILEVDLEYPNHLFEKHRDLPFCAEFAKPPGGKHKKLLTTLHSKQHYVAHYKLLQQAVDNGLQIVKIHRVIKFKQSHWLKQYIDLNTEMRKNAKNNFEKDFFKLMNNAVFGKTMENVRKRPHFRLVSNDEKLKKLISKPYFLDRVIYAENLVGIHLARTQILFDKALYVGMCILELSKVHIYNFHHNIMKEQFGDNLKLCYMDTDSFIYLIERDDLYHDLQNVRDHLDTSVYSPNHILFSTHNKGVLGKFKGEIPNSHIDEFVGLKAKVYALKSSDFEIKKLKGVKKSVIRNELAFDDYATCRESGITTYTKNNAIRSYFHNVFTMCVNKVTLNSFDDKRVVLQDGINTAPHGFYEPPCKRRRVQE